MRPTVLVGRARVGNLLDLLFAPFVVLFTELFSHGCVALGAGPVAVDRMRKYLERHLLMVGSSATASSSLSCSMAGEARLVRKK
ncbi:MAG: hypothetical protein JWR21_1796 [Herminiimonas sp.]|nr:hypothetical protein [Herminiimonas sp.]